MSTAFDPSLPAAKRKRTGNTSLSDYPLATSQAPVVSFFGYSLASTGTQTSQAPRRLPQAAAEENRFTWSFLSHPILQHLRKWPGLSLTRPTTAPAPAEEAPAPKSGTMNLLKLLEIPPIATSLASHLYGHDLLSLRVLNRSFNAALSTETAGDASHSYYHMLLLKSMLCVRSDTATEPLGSPCKSAGGNVGPCTLCERVICGTCVSPEIWTNRRYRYLCPTCCASSNTATCNCQQKIWMCRPCYKIHWIEDLDYDCGDWLRDRNMAATAKCHNCQEPYTHKKDPRLPVQFRKRVGFRNFYVRAGEKRRPVGCGWCGLRVDPQKEDWGLRPAAIRRGEEKGKRWIREMERRRRERDGEPESDRERGDRSERD